MAKLRTLDDEALEKPFSSKMLFRLLAYLKPYKLRVSIAFALMVTAALCSIGGPFLMSRAIGDCLETGDMTLFPWYIGGMVLLSCLFALCLRYRARLLDYAGCNALVKLRQDLFDHIQGLAMTFFDTRSAGKIMVRVINDVNSLQDILTQGIVNVLIDCLTVFILLGIMFAVNWQLTLVSMSVLPLLLLVLFKLKRLIRTGWQKVRMKISSMNGYLHESLAGMRVTEAFVREDENAATFNEVNADIRQSWIRAMRVNGVFWPSLEIVSSVGTVLVYIVGVKMMNAIEPLPLENLLLITWYLGRFWEPLNNLSNFYNGILVAMASLERIFEIMDTPQDIRDMGDEPDLPPVKGDIAFDDVTFSYDSDKVVLKNVSFEVKSGQSIALVGPTGAGKSTIVNLVSRFYDTTSGSVMIDGHDIKNVRLNSLRRQMSVMMQDSFIFSGSLMDNIRYGRLSATDDEVIAAAKAVNAHEFIMNTEKGYQTEVNERGSMLSVGQKQLISFARALLNDPRILILDEATSSIDTHTEMLIQQALQNLLKGRTSFIIAHRLSTIRNADRIMVVDDGHIVESGTHDELIKLDNGLYRGLCEAQYRFLKTG